MAAWTAIDNDVLRNPNLDVFEKVVYGVVKSHMNGTQPAFPGIRTIAKEVSCSIPSVLRALHGLEAAGLLQINSQGNGHRAFYQITDQPSLPLLLITDQPSLPLSGVDRSTTDHNRSTSDHDRSTSDQKPINVVDPKKSNKKIKKNTKEEEVRAISPENHAKLLEAFEPIWGKEGVEERIAECLAYPFARTKNRDWYLTTRKWLRDEAEKQKGRNYGQHQNYPRKPQQAPRPGDLAYYEKPDYGKT